MAKTKITAEIVDMTDNGDGTIHVKYRPTTHEHKNQAEHGMDLPLNGRSWQETADAYRPTAEAQMGEVFDTHVKKDKR